MSTLHDRLADLADDAPDGQHPPSLWDDGRRLGRRRRAAAATATLAAVVVAVGLGTVLVDRIEETRIAPAESPGELVLPDRFFTPSRYLPDVEAGQPIGPLVAVMQASQEDVFFGEESGLVGVSATTQEYRFLDLPDLPESLDLSGTGWSLSPSGRWVAYWYASGDRKSPDAMDGMAAYDTTTGQVLKYPMPSELGVMATSLVWSGESLWFGRWEFDSLGGAGSSSQRVETVVWDLPDAAPEVVEDVHGLVDNAGPGQGSSFAALKGVRVFEVSSPDDLEATPIARLTEPTGGTDVVMSPDGARCRPPSPCSSRFIAVNVDSDNGEPDEVRAGLIRSGIVRVGPDPEYLGEYRSLLGWRDNQTVVVEAVLEQERVLLAVDVVLDLPEAATVLSTFGGDYSDSQVATDLLGAPVADAIEPPSPLDPFKVALAITGGLVAVGVLVLWWRRRARI